MQRKLLSLVIILFFVIQITPSLLVFAQDSPPTQYLRIAGQVIDVSNGKPIEFVAIQILSAESDNYPENPIGIITDEKGNFDFSFQFTSPYKIRVSHISYKTTEVLIEKATFQVIKIDMIPTTMEGEVLYVTSQIFPEEELKNNMTTDRISNVDVEQVASFSAFDLVSSLREVDVATQSLNLQSISTRGFNSTANPRFLQLTDGIDNVAPGLGFPIGNLLGPSEPDIAGIELIVGPASARYGSSAMNGALITASKDAFDEQGITINIKRGVHHVDLTGDKGFEIEGDRIFDGSFRIAKAIKDKFAIKLTGTYIQGKDWRATNYDHLGLEPSNFTIEGIPGYNGINTYGDENYAYLPVGQPLNVPDRQAQPDGSYMRVTRTGYRELDLVNYDISTLKGSASLLYKFNENTKVNLEGRYGYTNTLYTSDSRIRLQNFDMNQFKAELNSSNFYIRGYTTKQNSGNSYNVNYLAQQLIEDAKSNSNWFRDFEKSFLFGISYLGVRSGDWTASRDFADQKTTLLQGQFADQRYEPGTSKFNAKVDSLINIVGFDGGAGINDNSRLYHFEAGNISTDIIDESILSYGTSFRFYDLDSGGSLFPDTTGNSITNYEFGGYVQFEKPLMDDKLNILAAIRVDKNENYAPRVSQQFGFTYEISSKQFLRVSLQNGFRYPTIREQFLNTSTGKARLLGGLSVITEPYEIQNNSFYESAVEEFLLAVYNDIGSVDVEDQSYYQRQAELKNLNILENAIVGENDITKIKPEKTNAFEIGFRQLFTDNLYLDVNYFMSLYRDFIGIKRVVKPRSKPSEDLYIASGQATNLVQHNRYYVYSNSKSLVSAHGFAFDLKYSSGTFVTSVNGTLSKLIKESDDPIIPGFNTPPLKVNFEWGNREFIRNLGFKFSYKYRSKYNWESSFLDGKIEPISHFSFQFNLKIEKLNSTLKTGVSNLSTTSYNDVYGGPSIGTILFVTYSYNQKGF